MQGKTSTGFEFDVDERIRDDWRLLTAIADGESKDALKQIKGITNIVRLLLGESGEASLSEHIAKLNDGFVPKEAIVKELSDILVAVRGLKNS